MSAIDHPWEKIYQEKGRVFPEPFPRFAEIAAIFKDHGCQTILDLGCGNGRHVVHLAHLGFRVTGADISPTGLGLTQSWLAEEEQRAGLVQADFREPLPFRTGSFDCLLSTQVIHHALAAEVHGAIREIWRVLVPGGLAFVTVTAGNHDDEEFRDIEPGTFVPLKGPEAGLPHHVLTEDGLLAAFGQFQVEEVRLVAGGRVRTILAQKGTS